MNLGCSGRGGSRLCGARGRVDDVFERIPLGRPRPGLPLAVPHSALRHDTGFVTLSLLQRCSPHASLLCLNVPSKPFGHFCESRVRAGRRGRLDLKLGLLYSRCPRPLGRECGHAMERIAQLRAAGAPHRCVRLRLGRSGVDCGPEAGGERGCNACVTRF